MRRGIARGVMTLLCLAVVAGAATGIAAADGDDRDPDDDARPEDDNVWINETLIEDDGWDERAPYVDAGLDQEGYPGTDVILDGAGTWDDQDDIVHKEWTIETPSGDTIQPDCATCWFTTFNPSEVGEYAVTLDVRDSEGFENNDTLYVEVQPLGPGTMEEGSSESGGGGGGSGCFMAYQTGGSHAGCSNHGTFKGFVFDDQGRVEAYTFENSGVVDEYSNVDFEDGEVIVDTSTVIEEVDNVWDVASGYDARTHGRDSGSGGSDTTNVVEAMGYGSDDDSGGDGGGDSSDQAGVL